jgi:predicted alpha/beta hydrolase family esterase
METIILPGFSSKNKDWADDIREKLKGVVPATVIEWKHWQTGKAEAGWLDTEAKEICSNIREPINILAKSMGTVVAMMVLKLKPEYINKIILCGVPINDFLEGDQKYYGPLKEISSEKFVCYQNEKDNHGSYQEVEKFIHSLNQKINIVSKPRSDHEYPYPDEFIDFLTK